MPKVRLNKAVKELNISIPRAVEFLQSKGFEVEANPNAQLEEKAYSALEAEFAKDGAQRKASHEVVISKVPEEKLEIEEKKPEVIRAKANIKSETKILGKIDLNPSKPEPEPEVKQPEPVKEEKPEVITAEKQEFKVLDKIDLSKIESGRPKPAAKKEEPKAEPKAVEVKTPEPAAVTVKTEVTPTPAQTPEPVSNEPEKIETNYQKLDGPKILKQTVDLSQFAPKPKTAADKKKKRKSNRKQG